MIERIKSAMVGAGAAWVLWLMLALSVVSLAIMLERAWLYWSLRDDIEGLMRELGRLLRAGDLEGARRRLEASPERRGRRRRGRHRRRPTSAPTPPRRRWPARARSSG